MAASCAATGGGAWCDAVPAQFGTRSAAAIRVRLTTSGGEAVEGRVRWRRVTYLRSPGEWQEGAADQNGQLAVPDTAPGRYELEVCAAADRALHGYLEIAPGGDFAVTLNVDDPGEH